MSSHERAAPQLQALQAMHVWRGGLWDGVGTAWGHTILTRPCDRGGHVFLKEQPDGRNVVGRRARKGKEVVCGDRQRRGPGLGRQHPCRPRHTQWYLTWGGKKVGSTRARRRLVAAK